MNTSDYENSELNAVNAGKKELKRSPNLSDRALASTKGFFYELRVNDTVHPNHYAVHCVDGAGTKIFMSSWSGKYNTLPIDAIAMNANDMATAIRAYPDTANIYIATKTKTAREHMAEIMSGFREALARLAPARASYNPNIGKIETASLDEMIESPVRDEGWDVGVSMIGYIVKGLEPTLTPEPGDLIIGVASSGLHSNGYTHARHALLSPAVESRLRWKKSYTGRFMLDDKPEILCGESVLEAMIRPTALYLRDSLIIGERLSHRGIYGVNITGNGLANLNRAGKGVSFEITDPLPPQPIHLLLVQEAKFTPQRAYTKHNMGMGFVYISPKQLAQQIVGMINANGENKAKIVGEVAKNGACELTTTIHEPYEGKALTIRGYM